MRTVFFLLLLANAGAFAWNLYGDSFGLIDADLMRQQLQPEAIRLLSAEQVARLPAKAPEPKIAPCLELGEFTVADADSIQQALEQLGLGGRLAQRRREEATGFWVYMPPQATRQAATQKTAELKRLGVNEFFVVEDPKWRFAISLGVFKSEEAAQTRLEELRARGVRTARLGPRDSATQRIVFTVRDVPEADVVKLNQLRMHFPDAELKECAR